MQFPIKSTMKQLVTLLFVILWVSPFLYLVNSSLKTNAEWYNSNPLSLPKVFDWHNYLVALQTLAPYFRNSVIYVCVALPVVLVISTLAAYALARMRFRLRGLLSVIFMFGLMMPLSIFIVPLYVLYREWGLLGTMWCLIITYITTQIPYTIYLIRGYMMGIPAALEEAALIDGCNQWGIFLRVIVPLSKPILMTALILDFFGIWNDFFVAYTFMQNNALQPIQLSILNFVSQFSTSYNLESATLILMVIPTLVVFLIFQRHIMRREGEGALKG